MKLTLIIILIVIFAVIAFLGYYGLFYSVKVLKTKAGPFYFVYEDYNGAYKNTKEVMDKIYYRLLNEDGIETYKGAAIYFDNPKEVAEENLRSQAGCLLEIKDIDQLEEISEKYRVRQFAKAEYVHSEFPFKGVVSIMFSIMKVYPAIGEYMTENKIKNGEGILEVYDMPNKKILYYVIN